MNTPHNPRPDEASAARQIDRLVDGELDASQQQALLRELEASPDGWRRCALAFVEAQTWKSELSLLGDSPRSELDAPLEPKPSGKTAGSETDRIDTTRNVAPAEDSPPGGRRWHVRGDQLLMLAASVVIAFALGALVGDGQSGQVPLAGDDRQQAPAALANHEHEEAPQSAVELAETNQPSTPSPRSATPGGPGERFAGDVLLAGDGTDSPVVPPEIRRLLQRAGYQMREQRRLVPIEIEGGASLYVPIEQVEFEYIGNAYQ